MLEKSISNWQSAIGNFFLDLLVPRQCELCGKFLGGDATSMLLCGDCLRLLPSSAGRRCRRCFLFLGQTLDVLCADCRKMPQPVDLCLASGEYDAGLRELIGRFKYGKKRYLSGTIGHLMLRAGAPLLRGKVEVVIPVPLTRRKRWENNAARG